jgi:hypothetical protein
MNPYSPPEADLTIPTGPSPLLIKLVVGILAFSLCMTWINAYFISYAYDETFFDPFTIGLNVLWSGIIIWLCHDLLRAKNNPKFTMLILFGIVAFFTVDDPISALVVSIGILEAGCYLICFFILNLKSVQPWFIK